MVERRGSDRWVAYAPWLTREVAAYAGLVVVALFLRLIGLGDKPMHHDESLHATYSWYLYHGAGYQYDPMMHGPFQFHVTALIFVLFGVSEFTARLLPALFGSAIVALPWFLRKELGRFGALVLAAMLTISPSFLYFSRFERNDMYIAFYTLALIALFFRFVERPRGSLVVLMALVWALSFTTQENTYITAFVLGLYVLAVVGWELAQSAGRAPVSGAPVDRRWRPVLDGVRTVGADPFLYGLALFAIVFTVLFTTVFTHPQGLVDGLTRSITYWLSQQPVARGSEPWYYYLVLMPAYEPLAIAFGLAGCVLATTRRSYWTAFLLWYAAGMLALYTWASEKMPWIILHPLLPFFLLAAWFLNWLWCRRSIRAAQVAFGLAGVLGLYAVHSATLLSYVNQANPSEMLVYTQTSDDVVTVAHQIDTLSRRSGQGQAMPIVVDGKDAWPFIWYLRDYTSVAYPPSITGPQSAPVVVVADDDNANVAPLMSGYTVQRYKLRVWWVEQPLNQSSPAAWARWLLWREPWNPLGSYDFYLYVKQDLAAGP